MIPWVRAWLKGREYADLNDVGAASVERDVSVNDVGAVYTVISNGNDTAQVTGPNSDNKTVFELFGLVTLGTSYLYNEGTFPEGFDRQRNNVERTPLASAARTADTNSADLTNYNHKGGHFILNVTAVTGSASVVLKVQGKDPASGNYYDMAQTGAITTTGINILKVYPGIQPLANGAFSDSLPRIYRVRVEHANADSITYSVGNSLVL